MDAMTAARHETPRTPVLAPAAAADAASLAAAIQALHGMQRLVVSLCYGEGLRLPEVALVLEMSEIEVAQLYAQALATLRGEPGAAYRHAA